MSAVKFTIPSKFWNNHIRSSYKDLGLETVNPTRTMMLVC